MARLSRRKLIAGAAAAPLALNGAAYAAAEGPDPIIAMAYVWMAKHETYEALIREWQDQEAALFAKVKAMNMSADRGMRSGLAEARAMRALERKINAARKKLDRDARRIALMRPTSAEGALAKIRLGVHIQGPYDWNDDYVHVLVQDGCEQLARMLAPKA